MQKFFLTCLSFFCYMIVILNPVSSFAESDKLEELRSAIKEEGLTWTANENWVTRLSPQERRKLFMNSYAPPEVTPSDVVTFPQKTELPQVLDWRNISQNNYQGNYVTSIKNQGNCGSCWAFSAVAQIESWWLVDNNRPDTTLDLSEQTLLSSGFAGSCDGGNVHTALEWTQRNGIPPEWCFEYKADDTLPLDSAYADWRSYAYTIPGWNYITGNEANINNIKNALMYHPVSAFYEVYTDFSYYWNGVYEPADTSTSTGSWHAVLIVGWNDADSSWICKNSWGRWWGDNGYFKIKWGVCHIGESIPFIWNEVGGGNNITVGEDSVSITLTQGTSVERSITVFNSGPVDIDFAAFSLTVPVKFHVDDFNAYEGKSWWCGDSELGGYDNRWLQYLQTPLLDLSGTENARLEYKGYWAIEDPAGATSPWDGWDGCNVWLSTDGGENYSVIEPEFPEYNCQHLWSFGHPEEGWNMGENIAGWGGESDGWVDVAFDLSGFTSHTSSGVILRWAFASDLAYCTEDDPSLYGFFVDNIKVFDDNKVIFENYGEDDGEMIVDGYGSEETEWLSINNGVGTITAGGQLNVDISIDTENVEPGSYEGSVMFTVSDTLQERITIPVMLTVKEKETDVADNTNQNPETITLYDNYPNPFNPVTTLSYYLPERSKVRLIIFDIKGREIVTLVEEIQNQGVKQINWDGKDSSGNIMSSGMYIYSLYTDDAVLYKKMLLIR